MTIEVVRRLYKVFRSILFTAIVAVVALYLSIYILLSIPPIEKYLAETAERELSAFLGGDVKIGEVAIFPFNEVRLKNVVFYTPDREKCISIGTLGAGIHLWRLVAERKIEITYAEILDLDGKIWQREKDGPLNISYIIDAFAPKDKDKPPTKFDLRFHNIVIRKSSLSFDRLWVPVTNENERFDINHLSLKDLNADVTIPLLKNEDFIVDLRRLSFKSGSGFDVKRLSFKTHFNSHMLAVEDFFLLAGRAELSINNQIINFESVDKIYDVLKSGKNDVSITLRNFYPVDFRFLHSTLDSFKDGFDLSLSVKGNFDNLNVEDIAIDQKNKGRILYMAGKVDNIAKLSDLNVNLNQLNLILSSELSTKLMQCFPLSVDGYKKVYEYIDKFGDMELDLFGDYAKKSGSLNSEGFIQTEIGSLKFDVDGFLLSKDKFGGEFNLLTSNTNLGKVIGKDSLGELAMQISGEVNKSGNDINGNSECKIDHIEFNGNRFSNIAAHVEKKFDKINAHIEAHNELADLSMTGEIILAQENSRLIMDGEINRFYPSALGVLKKYDDYLLKCAVNADLKGDNVDNLTGDLLVSGLSFLDKEGKGIKIKDIAFNSDNYIVSSESTGSVAHINRRLSLNTEFLNASVDGRFKFRELIGGVKEILSNEVSELIKAPSKETNRNGYAEINAKFFADPGLPEFFHIPFKPLKDIDLVGSIDLRSGKIECSLEAPYLLQGGSKLISNTLLYATAERDHGASMSLNTVYPIKNDRIALEIGANTFRKLTNIDLGWVSEKNSSTNGNIKLSMDARKDILTGRPAVNICIQPSSFRLGPSEWTVGSSNIMYTDKRLNVDNLKIAGDNQFIEINGLASSDPEDELNVRLGDIDLDYIFSLLNINYVSFGGTATGDLSASSIFSRHPVVATRGLYVRDLSYNDAVLGDASIYSCWNNERKEVEIHADIQDSSNSSAKIDGGIFVAKDSLSFDMKANKVNIGFLKPFMAAFTSDVGGRASGDIKLYGTFKDIDLIGKAFADSLYMKVDYTNVYYHGSDSVLLRPGYIDIPTFRLYDKYDHPADLSGFVKHRYFHDPEFEFRINNARNLLCYDTNSLLNPDWYGTIYASGNGTLKGRPGIVAMEMDMTTNTGSDFTFVLNETQTALDYTFLTFSDKNKKAIKDTVKIEETFEQRYVRKKAEESNAPSIFSMDLRASVTPGAKMNLIMDPNAGDKIVAHGGGPLLIHYDTESDEMTMYGKYTLTEGNYNFSLQELILRSFNIRAGSSISFNGDPLAANLDIIAAYRVNTNLSDLDKSFSTDRDLNRTNVPVDALLKVKGDLDNPEISFDISLPTLTSDVERKVKSIISTDDMMNRQIIYLLALNRFYTPEYMGVSSSGGSEFASVASSTISSQLSNIMGQLTNKLTVAPSFRSDKGDFSDMEVDVSLSSRLLNNRLLINGNFGYRDRSTSQTTFVGDFDIEYLLSRNGNIRLKAYNHFNDQNYYLKSSLTTQGLGIMYRKEFNNPFSWLKRKKRKPFGDKLDLGKEALIKKEEGLVMSDSINDKKSD